MKTNDLIEKLNLEIISGKKGLEKTISGAYVSDMLSDVMGNAKPGQVWVTMQTHKNVVAVASLKDLAAVILVGKNQPDQDTLEHSNKEEIPLLLSKEPSFYVSGRLYNLLIENDIIQG